MACAQEGQFEIFWYSHHFFIGFFLFLIIHGAGTIGPNYWKYFVFPGSLYVIERVARIFRAAKPVVLLSVRPTAARRVRVFAANSQWRVGTRSRICGPT